jgi:hypothetical protein
VQTLPLFQIPNRQVDRQWRCQRSGDCCTKPQEVVMTKQEASHLVFHAPPTIRLQFRPVNDKFVAMKAGPCPLFVFKSCIVYEHRPYNCRRFACMRPDPASEPLELDGQDRCLNFWDRIATSKEARKLARWIQRRAQEWAHKMGWMDDGPGEQQSLADVSRGDGLSRVSLD